jgi:DNA replication protein DnaC
VWPEFTAEQLERIKKPREAQPKQREAQARDRRAARLGGIALDADTERKIVAGEPLDATKSLAAMRAWTGKHDVRPVLVLAGTTGVGKSVAAAWAVANRVSYQRPEDPENPWASSSTNWSENCSRWYNARKLCNLFDARFGDQLGEQEMVARCELLVLDDVGTELDAGKMGAILCELIEDRKRDARYMRTVVTTNLGTQAFRERYADPRLASRLEGHASSIVDAGPDLRRGRK